MKTLKEANKILKKILNFLNVHPDDNQKWILIGMFFTGLIYTYINPTLTKTIISALPAQWIAFQSVFSSVTGLLIGMAWKGGLRKKAINKFIPLCVAEELAGFLVAMYLCFINWNIWVYAIATLLYTNLFSIFIGKCLMTFRAKLWNDREREIYENNSSVIGGIVCVIGFTSAILFLPSLKLSLFLWGMCCIFDDVAWIYVYFKNKDKLREVEYGKDTI